MLHNLNNHTRYRATVHKNKNVIKTLYESSCDMTYSILYDGVGDTKVSQNGELKVINSLCAGLAGRYLLQP